MEKQARKAVGVDSELKAANLNRLKRIEEPDEESPAALRDEGDQQRQTQGGGGDVRRTAGARIQAFAVKGAEGRASPAPTSEEEDEVRKDGTRSCLWHEC